MKQVAPAAERNREAIVAVLRRVLPPRGDVLEIASGSGQHAVYAAQAFPDIVWHPSDPSSSALASIAAWAQESALANLRPPVALDVTASPWPVERAAAVVCINMVHIAPWEATLALFGGGARLLAVDAPLVTYGPYRFAGQFTSASNEEFDHGLRARDSRWGVRDVVDVEGAAAAAGLRLDEIIAMPANNHVLLFRRVASGVPVATLAPAIEGWPRGADR